MKRVEVSGHGYPQCISEFVEDVITNGSDSRFDKYDGIEKKIDRLSNMFGRLLETLANKGHLTDEQLLDIIVHYSTSGYNIVNEDEG